MIKTINLDGTEQAVKFAGKHTHFHVHSLGGEVLVSLASGIERGKDGVLIVQGGGAGYVQNDMATDTVYLVGSGEVQIVGSGNAFSPFKIGAEGGGNGSVISEGGTVTGTVDYPILSLNLYGKSVQNGTPTPDATIDIVSVGDDGNVKITSRSNNLFDFNAFKNSISYTTGVTYVVIDNGVSATSNNSIAKVNTNYYMDVIPGKKYTLSMNTVTNQGFAVIYGNNKSEVQRLYATGSRSYITFDVPSDVTQVCILIWFDKAGENNTFSNFQFEEGSAATAYAPYGNTATITSGLPLCSVGNVSDELIYNADGTGKIIKRTAKIVLDGSNDEDWLFFTESGAPFQIYLKNGILFESQTELPKLYCNKYQRVPQGATWGNYDYMVSVNAGGTSLVIRDISVTTLEEFKAKLNAVPMAVVYVLATPQEIELSAAEMTLLMQLQTFEGTTYIYNDEDAEIKVKIVTNPMFSELIKPVLDGINAKFEARISALEAAITSNT